MSENQFLQHPEPQRYKLRLGKTLCVFDALNRYSRRAGVVYSLESATCSPLTKDQCRAPLLVAGTLGCDSERLD